MVGNEERDDEECCWLLDLPYDISAHIWHIAGGTSFETLWLHPRTQVTDAIALTLNPAAMAWHAEVQSTPGLITFLTPPTRKRKRPCQ